MGSIIKCCHHCVPPKRHPGCHGTCPDYIEERALYDELKDAADQVKHTQRGIVMQRDEAVRKALKGKR